MKALYYINKGVLENSKQLTLHKDRIFKKNILESE